jgi:L-fuconolactonase
MKRRIFLKSGLLTSLGGFLSLPPLPGNFLKPSIFNEENFEIIDSHLHLWDLQKMDYPWLENKETPISRNFLVKDFKEATANLPVKKMIFVECGRVPEQYLEEVDWVIERAREEPGIKGMVAYFPVEKATRQIPELEELTSRKIVRGIRSGMNQEIINSEDFLKGLKILPQYTLSYDLNIGPALMSDAVTLIRRCPGTTFILDHLCNPDVKGKEINVWKKNIDLLAEMKNVNCKISGIITKAGQNWTPDDLRPYIDHALDAFGTDRVLFGGDWPVVLLAGSYKAWYTALLDLVSGLSLEEKKKLFYYNAEKIYRI